MATQKSDQSEEIQTGVKELEKEITCPVCHDHFQEPKILPCLHYYCKGCIRALALRAGNDKPFPCPECRNDTVLPQNDPDRLPTAFFVNRMTELHAKMEKAHGKVEAMCEQCSESKAVAFCRQCTEFICDGCVKIHKKLKVLSDHKVTTLEELKEGGAKQIFLKQAPPPMCNSHDEQMKIYCYECKHLICRDCVLDDHAGHKYDFVKKAAPAIKEKLVERLAPLRETQASLCDANKVIRLTKSDIERQGASVAVSIEQSFQELHDILEQHKRELLEKTSSLVKGKLDRLSVQEKGIDMASGTVQSLVEFVEQNIENAMDEELMTIHTQMLNRIDEETKKHQQSSAADLEPVEEADIVVGVECAGELKKLCQEKAVIITSPYDPFKSTVEGEGTRSAEINKVAKVKFHAVFPCSNQQRKPVTVEARLVGAVTGAAVQAKIEQKHGSIYEIEYTPAIRGRHQLEITVNGLPVAGSPFPVFVKIHPTQLGKPIKVYPGFKGHGIAFNSRGEIVFAEQNGDILLLDKAGSQLHRIEKSQHGFKSLFGVAVDNEDNIYITDNYNGSVLKFDKYGTKLKFVKPAVDDFTPCGIAVSGDQVIVADESTHQLLCFTRDLQLAKTIDFYDVIPAGVACDEDGKIYVCGYSSNFVQVFSAQGERLYSFGVKGSASCKLDSPHSICVDSDLVYVTEWGSNHCISVFTKEGKFITSFGKKGSKDGDFSLPSGLAVDNDGILYVCDFGNSRIQSF